MYTILALSSCDLVSNIIDFKSPSIINYIPMESNISSYSNFKITFSEPLKSNTIDSLTVYLIDSANNNQYGNVLYNKNDYSISLRPTFKLNSNQYILTIKRISDENGNFSDQFQRVYNVSEEKNYCYIKWGPQVNNEYAEGPHFFKYKLIQNELFIEADGVNFRNYNFSSLRDLDVNNTYDLPFISAKRYNGVLYLELLARYSSNQYPWWDTGRYNKILLSDINRYLAPNEILIKSSIDNIPE